MNSNTGTPKGDADIATVISESLITLRYNILKHPFIFLQTYITFMILDSPFMANLSVQFLRISNYEILFASTL